MAARGLQPHKVNGRVLQVISLPVVSLGRPGVSVAGAVLNPMEAGASGEGQGDEGCSQAVGRERSLDTGLLEPAAEEHPDVGWADGFVSYLPGGLSPSASLSQKPEEGTGFNPCGLKPLLGVGLDIISQLTHFIAEAVGNCQGCADCPHLHPSPPT